MTIVIIATVAVVAVLGVVAAVVKHHREVGESQERLHEGSQATKHSLDEMDNIVRRLEYVTTVWEARLREREDQREE